MKLSLEQNDVTVTIECKGDGHTGDQMAQFCREALLAQGYHWNTVSESMPTEEDVVEEIREALELQRNEDFFGKGIDKDEVHVDTIP